VFNFVSNYSYPRFSVVIDDVKKVQNELEGYYLAQQKTVDETALSLLKNSRGEAIEYLTNYSVASGEKTYKRWKQLGEELLQKNIDGISKTEFFQPKNIGYPDHFKKRIIDESGDKFKMKEIITDPELAYNQNLIKADQLVVEKKYSEAKSFYQKALEIKPNEDYPKQKIEKIESILGAIDQIHNSTF
jgi:hypothetical protein